jgi:hypothetical protein
MLNIFILRYFILSLRSPKFACHVFGTGVTRSTSASLGQRPPRSALNPLHALPAFSEVTHDTMDEHAQKHADEVALAKHEDEAVLARLGYKQVLFRTW